MSNKISVIGAGTMGSGIAQVAASNSCQVTIVDSFPQALESSQSKLKSILNRLVEKGKMNEDKTQHILANINWTSETEEIADSDLVIEAIVENLEIISNDKKCKIKSNIFILACGAIENARILLNNTKHNKTN